MRTRTVVSLHTRRQLLRAAATSALALSLSAVGQNARTVKRIGYLRLGVPPPPADAAEAANRPPFFWPGMRPKGWVPDVNVSLIHRFATGPDELSSMAAELVALNVDLILTNGTPATIAAKKATDTIPIVFWLAADPVANGIVKSLARPEGNVTGFFYGDYPGKLLEVARDALPRARRAVYPLRELSPAIREAAEAVRIQVQVIPVDGPQDFGRFFVEARKAGFDIAVIPDVARLGPFMSQIAAASVKHLMPSVGYGSNYAEDGGLLAYGPESEHEQRVPVQIDRILRGAKIADVAIEQPLRFTLTINRTTQAKLGLTLPKEFVARAVIVS